MVVKDTTKATEAKLTAKTETAVADSQNERVMFFSPSTKALLSIFIKNR
jgi:hypothetical protein